MAKSLIARMLGSVFGPASVEQVTASPSIVELATQELKDLFAPLSLASPNTTMTSKKIGSAVERAFTIIASSKCDYTHDIDLFRNSLSKIKKHVADAEKSENDIIQLPLVILQDLTRSLQATSFISTALDKIIDPITLNQGNDTQTTKDIFIFEDFSKSGFAAPDNLSEDEASQMKNEILKFGDNLALFLRKHDIQPQRPPPPDDSYHWNS